ncbi:DUF4388 domain-containing protein [candidate division CSSED10-310 bacterium]|uniref:DUF4388 domain-containing protein n=1 Tax=candidate division CSSED10-310 bacterium TaxID=2855610 RepID=A0ABV6Z238_UNCC1
MFGTRFMAISLKFTLTISILLVVLVPISEYVSYSQLSDTISRNLRTKGSAITQNVASTCTNAIIGHDYTFLKYAIDETKKHDPDVVYGIIMKEDNTVMASTEEQQADTPLNDPTAVLAGKSQELGFVDIPEKSVKEFFAPIFINKDRFGTIRFGFSTASLKKARNNAIITAVVKALVFILIFNIAAFALSKKITFPIKQLVQDAATISSGNLDKEIQVASSDEVGLLAHAFEKMRTSLKVQIKEIAKKAMGLEGELDVFALPDLLQLVCSSRRTGQLFLENPTEKGQIYVDQGEIIHALLGKSLEGREAIYKFFNWTSGSFKFEPGPVEIERSIKLGWQHLIMEGARHTDEMDRIKQIIPSPDIVVTVVDNPPEGVDEIKLTVEELQVSILVQGAKKVSEILEESNFDEFETYQMLYRLISAGLLKVSD